MNDEALRLDGVLVVRGGCPVLEVPSLVIPAGTRTAVTGPIGSGKTTLLLAAAGLIDLAAGSVSLWDRPYHSGRAPGALDLRRRLAFVAQEPCLFAATVTDNLLMGLRYRGVGKDEGRKRSAAWLERLGLSGLADRRATRLSGGERRLVALARALVLEPDLLLLDEPTAHLDRDTALQVEGLLGGALPGTTTLLVATHDWAQAERLAVRVLCMESGRIL
jgi:ABC-type sulfate/molybdate transport systems ATPase subunit